MTPVTTSTAEVATRTDVESEELADPSLEALVNDPLAPAIALVPLDSRPCSWLYPQRLADIAGVRLSFPPIEFLGWRDRKADVTRILDWLSALPTSVEALLLSLDTLLYGGLVQSRASEEREMTVDEIVVAISEFLKVRLGCRLHCFKSVPRIGSTVLNSVDLELYDALWRKGIGKEPLENESTDGKEESQKSDEGGEGEGAETGAPISKIEDAWKSCLRAREKNQNDHAELLKKLLPLATSWCIAVEDNHPDGPQNKEVEELLAGVAPGSEKKVTALNGCDEEGMVMLARHLRDRIEGDVSIGIWWSAPGSLTLAAKFEGIPVVENLERFARHLGLSLSEVEIGSWSDSAEVALTGVSEEIRSGKTPFLIINNFETEQNDHLEGGSPLSGRDFGENPMRFLSSILLIDSLDIHLADIAWANGGDPSLDEALGSGYGNYLSGYSSWNTAGNTLGKALSQIVCRAYRLHHDPKGRDSVQAIWARERFKFESLLSDRWFPQIVRPAMWKLVQDNNGDPWHFDLYTMDLVEKGCQDLKKPVFRSWNTRHRSIYQERGISVPDTMEAEITFPWNRLFEVDIRIYADEDFHKSFFVRMLAPEDE